ncbi:hypothetical protein Nepgr_005522 [Nepenthes gracilis]|uniref:CRAL-TRIO domain-containing protein n=1 Tax=Nepenthes gracilis TaxID=150966 RepID=A0AAD3S3D7_NEPGR|nr:hypothetical protein Nepgr_005522 [Nepenthes gracilis]
MENGRQPEEPADRKSDDDREEEEKLGAMRAFVESRDPSSKAVDDLVLRRFLRARNLEIETGGGLFLRYLKWRRDFVPNGRVVESEIPNEIEQDKVFIQGFDKKARPIAVAFGARHFPGKQPDEFKRLIVYLFDKLSARTPAGQEKFAVIADLQGWGYSNIDLRGYLGIFSILQDYYPERLGRLFMIHVPRLFFSVWKIIYPFIDKKTRSKIIFVENKVLKSTLLEEIDEDQLPEIYGGRQPLVPMHHA